MNSEPLFSVLIANYNNGKYLQEAIESVKAQTYTNWEIILVDDGSTDNSHELYKQLEKDSRIHIYYNGENKGCGYTKRRCAELANGDICGFLDPDDQLLPGALACHVYAHVDHPTASVVYSRSQLCDNNGVVIGESKLPDFKERETYFDYRDYGVMHLASYKNEYYKKTAGISPYLKAGVDQDLYFKIEEVGSIYPLDKFTYKYYKRENGHELTSLSNQADLWYWNMVARRDTCQRRHLDESDVLRRDFVYIYTWLLNEEKVRIEQQVRSSWPYRIGKAIMTPFYCIKRLLS